MNQAAKSLPINAPAQVGARIDSSLARLAKQVGSSERKDATQNAKQCDFVGGQGRLPVAAPDFLVGIGEQGVSHFGEARSAIRAIFCGNMFWPKIFRFHKLIAVALVKTFNRQPNFLLKSLLLRKSIDQFALGVKAQRLQSLVGTASRSNVLMPDIYKVEK